MTDWRNECTSEESLPGGRIQATIGIKPRAHWAAVPGGGRILRAIASDWVQGDADLPHLVAESPIRVGTADSGRRRLYPVPGDLTRYIEVGAPMIKPAGSWVSVGFANATRTGNRITWSRPQANMSVTHGGHFIKLDIELLGGYVPPNSRFAFPVSLVGLTRDGARILADGKPVMLLRPPVVYDAANPDDVRPIVSTFGAIGGQTGVLFTLPSLAGMSRPVVDPTWSSQPAAAGKDVALLSNVATQNFGISTALVVGERNDAVDAIRRSLIQFDLSVIPRSAQLATTSLTLYAIADASSTARTLRAYRLKQTWVEGTKNGGAGPDGATWNTYDGTNNWASSGAFGATDCEQTDVGSRDFTDAETLNAAKVFTLTASKVQEWVTGVFTNNGLLLKADTETDDAYEFASSDHATEAYRPLLTVTYTLPTGGIGRGRSTLCRQGRNRWL